MAVARSLDRGALHAQQVMCRSSNSLIGVDNQDSGAAQPCRNIRRGPLRLRDDRCAHLVNDATNLTCPVEQVAEPGDDVFVMARIAVQRGGCVGDDIVQGKCHLPADRLHRGARGALLLGLQQFQRVQRRGNVAAVDLQELAIAIVEGARLRALDVERADDRAVIDEWHGQRAARACRPLDVDRVLGRVGTEVALPGGRHESRHTVAVLARESSRVAASGVIPSVSRGTSLPDDLSSRRISM